MKAEHAMGRYATFLFIILFSNFLTTSVLGEPRRVVSMNLCGDQLLMLLADRASVLSLSQLSRDPVLSYVAPQVDDVPQNHGMAEEVFPLDPDLVLAGSYTARPTVTFLKSKGIPILELSIPNSFAEIRSQVRRVAHELGRAAKGEELIARMDRILGDVPPRTGPRPLGLAWQAGGFTSGAGTLINAVFDAAGVDNLAARKGLTGYGYIGLEAVVASRPDLLVSESALPGWPSLQQAMLQHPAIADGRGVGRRIEVPSALTACGGPFTAEAVRIIRQASEP